MRFTCLTEGVFLTPVSVFIHLTEGGCSWFWRVDELGGLSSLCPGHSPAPLVLPCLPQLGPATEVDGAMATDFFTVLSTGQHFMEDQWPSPCCGPGCCSVAQRSRVPQTQVGPSMVLGDIGHLG